MAKNIPVRPSHQGTAGGNESASNSAVTAALKSDKDAVTGLWRMLKTAASSASAHRTSQMILIRTPAPKKITMAAMPGMQANNTNSIICAVVSRCWRELNRRVVNVMSGHVASLPCWHQVFDKWQKSESWSTTMGTILHNYDMEVGKMRELTVNELEEVSGAGISDALAYWEA